LGRAGQFRQLFGHRRQILRGGTEFDTHANTYRDADIHAHSNSAPSVTHSDCDTDRNATVSNTYFDANA
jgi:hypothetical protein